MLGCADVARAADNAVPLRPAQLKPDLSSPEGGLWGAADKAEAHVRRSADRNTDAALNDYVRGVVCRIAPDYCAEVRVYVLDRPVLNAAAAPNGYIEVNSGLLIRAETEDELAYVLGHEISHFARNHSLLQWNKTKSTANLVLALQVGVAIGAATAAASAASSGSPTAGQTIDSISRSAQSLNDLIYLAGMAAIFAYGREDEMEADALGYGRAAGQGYEKTAGAAIWTDVIAEGQASDFPKVRKAEARASVFNTHPVTEDRIAALSKLAGGGPAPPDREAMRRYRRHLRPYLSAWLRDDLRRRDFGQTLHLIGRLEALGEDLGVLEFYRGEALRLRRGEGDPAAALVAYRAATSHADAPAAAWRELGAGLVKAGDPKAGAAALEAYLARSPTADDRWLVETDLAALKAKLETP